MVLIRPRVGSVIQGLSPEHTEQHGIWTLSARVVSPGSGPGSGWSFGLATAGLVTITHGVFILERGRDSNTVMIMYNTRGTASSRHSKSTVIKC